MENVRVIRCSEDVPWGQNLVQFRLLYSGRLLGSSRTDTRAAHKHQIRRELHPQLKRLWSAEKSLGGLAELMAHKWGETHPECRALLPQGVFEEPASENSEELQRLGLQYLASKWERGGRGFVPLVTEEMALRCSLDILFLRPEVPGKILQSGDIDNRLKTLFDALRLPHNLEEAGGASTASEGTTFCLLQDDSLISEIRIVTDRLLLLPKEAEANIHDVFLVIDVKLETPAHGNWAFVFG
jgi:hypothetical protein